MLLLYMFYRFGDIGSPGVFLLGGYLYLAIFNYTTLMDKSSFVLLTALIHSVSGIGIIAFTGDWFLLSEISQVLVYLAAGYFIGSFFITALMYKREMSSTPLKQAPL